MQNYTWLLNIKLCMIKNVLKKIMIKKVIFAEVSEFQLNALFIIFRGPTIFYHISFQNCNQFF